MWDFVAFAKDCKETMARTAKALVRDVKRDIQDFANSRYTLGQFVGGAFVNTARVVYIGGVAVATVISYGLSLKFVDDMVIQPIKEWTKEAEEDDDWYTSSFRSYGRMERIPDELIEIAVPEDPPEGAGGTAESGGSEGLDSDCTVIEIGSYLYFTGHNLYGTYGGNGYGGNANGHPYSVRYDYQIDILIDTSDWVGRVEIERQYVEDRLASNITESNLDYLREHTSAAATCAVHMDIHAKEDGTEIYYYLTDFVWDNDEPFVWGFDESGLCIVGSNGKKYYDGMGNPDLPYYKDTVIMMVPWDGGDYYYAYTHFIPVNKPDAESWPSSAATLFLKDLSPEILAELESSLAQENGTTGDAGENGQDSGTGQDETEPAGTDQGESDQEPGQSADGQEPEEDDDDRSSGREEEPEDEDAEFVEPGPPTVGAEGNGTVEAGPDGTVTLLPDAGNHVGSVRINGQDTPVPQGGGQLTGLTPKDRVDAKFQEGAPQGGSGAPGNESINPNSGENAGNQEQGGGSAGGDLPEPEEPKPGDSEPEKEPEASAPEPEKEPEESEKEPEDRRPEEPGQPMAGLSCTRAQVIHYLWNRAGQPMATIENPFEDVLESDYYYEAVRWATEIGIIPVSGGGFQPHRICTYRERYWMIRLYFAQTGEAGN